MVFDLVWGTFDISVVKKNDRDIIVSCFDGDNNLGGRKFEENRFEDFLSKYSHENICITDVQKRRLFTMLSKLKEMLSIKEKYQVIMEHFWNDNKDDHLELSRMECEKINLELFHKYIDIMVH